MTFYDHFSPDSAIFEIFGGLDFWGDFWHFLAFSDPLCCQNMIYPIVDFSEPDRLYPQVSEKMYHAHIGW